MFGLDLGVLGIFGVCDSRVVCVGLLILVGFAVFEIGISETFSGIIVSGAFPFLGFWVIAGFAP